MRKFRVVLGYLTLILIAISMLYPFFAMVNLSFTDNNEIFAHAGRIFHPEMTLNSYKNVFSEIPMSVYFFNSLVVATIATVGQVIFASLAGYAFARLNFKYRNALFLLFLITMLIPPQVNIIPLFFLMRQYFLGLPKDLEESAKIDGCNLFQTFFKIALPLALPTVATLAIFTFVSTWNSFMWPLIVTNSEGMRTLPVGLAIYKGSFREITQWSELLACSVICTIPVIGVFLLGKKYFISDILQGSVKE